MQKNRNAKLLTAFSLLFVLAMSPLAVASAQTSSTVSTDASVSANVTASGSSSTSSTEDHDKKVKVKERLEKIRAEIAEKAKKRLETRDLRHDERDFRSTIAFSGETSGWAVIDGKAFKSTITLRDGKAAKVGEHQWRVAVNGTISVEDKSFDVHLKGQVQGKRHGGATVLLHGTIMNGEEHKIALSGYVAPTNVDNTFALAFTKAGFKGERYDFFQVGHVTTSPLTAADVSSQQSQDDMASFRAIISVE